MTLYIELIDQDGIKLKTCPTLMSKMTHYLILEDMDISIILIKYYILIIKHLNGTSIIQRMTYTIMHPMTF